MKLLDRERFQLLVLIGAHCLATPLLVQGQQPPTNQLARIPQRIWVKPVFLVPRDADDPPPSYAPLIQEHLGWCQRRYRELLFDLDTFQLAPGAPAVTCLQTAKCRSLRTGSLWTRSRATGRR